MYACMYEYVPTCVRMHGCMRACMHSLTFIVSIVVAVQNLKGPLLVVFLPKLCRGVPKTLYRDARTEHLNLLDFRGSSKPEGVLMFDQPSQVESFHGRWIAHCHYFDAPAGSTSCALKLKR